MLADREVHQKQRLRRREGVRGQAAALYDESLAEARTRGFGPLVIESLERLAHLAVRQGQRETAEMTYAEARGIRERLVMP